jgi:hypothetical protein
MANLEDQESVCAQLSFDTLPLTVPRELAYHILEHWIAPEQLVTAQSLHIAPHTPLASSALITALQPNPSDAIVTTYTSATDVLVCKLPLYLQAEYWRLRHLSWLKSPKAFTDPHDFYMGHWQLSLDPASRLPPFSSVPFTLSRAYTNNPVAVEPLLSMPHPRISHHGLERIELDFDASQYFALFNVRLPPFETIDTTSQGDERHHDAHLQGAASFLQHTQHLTLRFGDAYKWAHAWSDVDNIAWDEARCRPKVCESGVIVDWILEYAWDGGYLQHIPEIEISGDVQNWVKEKWSGIFERHMARARVGVVGLLEVHRPDMHAIEWRGMVEGEEEEWRAEEHYPPVCECEIGCWRLRGGGVVEEDVGSAENGWEDVSGDEGVVGGWDDLD